MIITVDDYLPFYNGYLLFNGLSKAKNVYDSFLEKAFAKVMGNYEFINYGWQAEANRVLNGAPTF